MAVQTPAYCMSGLRAELSVKNASDSPLADLSEIVSEPVTPLSLTLFDYILSRELPSRETGNYETQTDELNSNSQQLARLEPDENGVELTEIGALCGLSGDEPEVVSEVFAIDGTLHLTLEVGSREELRDYCADIENLYGPVSIDRIMNIRSTNQESEDAQIDLRTLTDRQYEVLETAYEMGYFGYPREANAEDVAEALGITSSTVVEHLTTAQSKLFDEIFQP